MPKMSQYCVTMKNEPGTLFRMTQVLSKAGINIDGIMSEGLGEISIVRFLAQQENLVRRTLETAGYEVFENPVFVLDLKNQPGELTKLAKCLSDENINIESLYATSNGAAKVVVLVDQPEKAQAIIAKVAELSKLGEPAHVAA